MAQRGLRTKALDAPWDPLALPCTWGTPTPSPPQQQVPARASLETLPRLLFLVGLSAWPFRACSSLESKTKRWPNLFPILWKELCNPMCLLLSSREGLSQHHPHFPGRWGSAHHSHPCPSGLLGHLGPVLKAPMGVSPEQHA